MGLLSRARQRWASWFSSSATPKTIGIYGPPNAGKSTLGNQIIRDWTPEENQDDIEELSTSEIAHETREATKQTDITINRDHGSVTLNIVDTPGLATKVNYKEFTQEGMEKEESLERAREGTEGIAEAMHWLREDIDGVIYMLDSTEDPFTQVNTMLLGIVESRNLPVVILANKTDLDESNVKRIRNAFPQHPVIPVSALTGENMDTAYDRFTEVFN